MRKEEEDRKTRRTPCEKNRRVRDDPRAPQPPSRAVSTCLFPPPFYSRVTWPLHEWNRTSPRKHRAGQTFPGDFICVVPSSSLASGSVASVACVRLSPSPSVPHSSSRAGRAMLCPSAVELRKQDGAPMTSAREVFKLKEPRIPVVDDDRGVKPC